MTLSPPSGLPQFLKLWRSTLSACNESVRIVSHSHLIRESEPHKLEFYMADRAPLFYRDPEQIIATLRSGYFGTAYQDTLARIPSAESFQESHFGEIVSGIFAEEVMGLVPLYSKLSLLTAENANAYKMDLLLCDPATEPIDFVFGEVKSSCKSPDDGMPPGHDKSCFVALFNSFNKYATGDIRFDLAAARDRLSHMEPELRSRVHKALMPYGSRGIRFLGFVVIDLGTKDEQEIRLLETRKNAKTFNIELLCVETLRDVTAETYRRLEAMRDACSP